MNKKIMLLALAAVSAAAFAMPSAASAELGTLHLSPTPASLSVKGTEVNLRSSAGTVTCKEVTGTVTPEAGGTTGNLFLTFGPHCTLGIEGPTCTGTNPVHPSGTIKTTTLPYHLVTVDTGSTPAPPGVLVTPANGAFAHFLCGGFIPVTVEGNGVIGTITSPKCGGKSKTTTLSFNSVGGNSTTQLHRYTHGVSTNPVGVGTTGPWSLEVNGAAAAQEGTATLTGTESELVCT